MGDTNWRQEVDAADHFLHERKRLDIERRRPVVRKASDLVGPGIGAAATRVTDWNDLLATYNGFYASLPGANAAPNAVENFTGFTIMDSTIGGFQYATGMASGNEYKRTFLRNPSDPSTIIFGAWSQMNAAAPTPLPVEMAYTEITSNWTTTNTSLYSTASTATVAGLSLTVTGEGKPVEIIFDSNVNLSAAGSVSVWFNSNGQNSANPGGAVALANHASNVNLYTYLSRRVVLVKSQQYTFTVGVAGSGTATTTVTATSTYPASLRIKRLG